LYCTSTYKGRGSIYSMEKVKYFYDDWMDQHFRKDSLFVKNTDRFDRKDIDYKESFKVGEIHCDVFYTGLFDGVYSEEPFKSNETKFIVCADFYIKVYKNSRKLSEFEFNMSKLRDELNKDTLEITKDTTTQEKMAMAL